MSPDLWLLLAVFSVLLGACVGSFLNVCIYRIPLDLSVVRPRSHCMACQAPIRWYDNIPIFSYLLLRGKCRNCRAPFSARYAGVELLTALLFALVWTAFPPSEATPPLGIVPLPSLAAVPVAWLFVSGLILGTFVDFDHYILPDSVTLGGIVAGLAVGGFVPELHGAAGWRDGLMRSATGALAGFAVLYAVVRLGKLAFGRKRVVLEAPANFVFVPREGAPPALRLGGAETEWDELFYRASDRYVLECARASLGDASLGAVRVVLGPEGLDFGGRRVTLAEAVAGFAAEVNAYTYPREAMGFGDVKLMAAVGAFLGWRAVPFSLIAAAFFGSAVGLVLIACGKRALGSKLPFGPYIALAAIVWLFWGAHVTQWYLEFVAPLPVP